MTDSSRTTRVVQPHGSEPDTPPASKPLGQLLVSLGVISTSQLGTALEIQRQQPVDDRQPLGRICVAQGFLSKERLALILDKWGKRLRLGELLANRGKVTPSQLDTALKQLRRKGGRLGPLLLELGFVDEYTLTEALAEQYDLPCVQLSDIQLDSGLVRFVNPHFAWRHGVVPIGRVGRRLTMAIHDPTQASLATDLEQATGMQIQLVLATPQEIQTLIQKVYASSTSERTERSGSQVDTELGADTLDHSLSEVLERAVALKAAEIHFEPAADGGEIRGKLDGLFRSLQGAESASDLVPKLVDLMKSRAGLDTTERRRLQEGFFTLMPKGRGSTPEIRLQVRTRSGPHGESADVEILDDAGPIPSFDCLGLNESARTRLASLIKGGKGVVLVVGPTGSGKRSTLRGAMDLLNQSGARVYSAEEMILKNYKNIEQVVIGQDGGKLHLSVLEDLMKKDPDGIVLERIPDNETAKLVFSSGLDRPLIISTLQVSNATAVAQKLRMQGVDPRAMARSLSGVIAQRLLRRVCPDCEESYEPRRSVIDEWFRSEPPFSQWRRGAGCTSCDGTGFSGRIVVSELWVPSNEERVAIEQLESTTSLRRSALQRSRCLGQDALLHAIEGRTTLEEALRFVSYEDVIYTRLNGLEKAKDEDGSDSLKRAV